MDIFDDTIHMESHMELIHMESHMELIHMESHKNGIPYVRFIFRFLPLVSVCFVFI
jgi:hypothetical protein